MSPNQPHESEIRPQDLYEKWKSILEKDLSKFFLNKAKLVKVDCPGCGKRTFLPAFTKFGFQYQRCSFCGSLFVSPRPRAEALSRFYRNSQAMKFWREKIMKRAGAARQRHQIYPLYVWFSDLVKEYKPSARLAVDYKAKNFSLFLLDKNFATGLKKIFLVEPMASSLDSLIGNIKKIKDLKKFSPGTIDILTAIDALDSEFDPAGFLQEAGRICSKGGLLFLTANTISGFEYQVLGRHSPRLVVPDRLNLLSVEAIEKLLAKAGFSIVDLATPGRLDVELVANTFQENPSIEMPEFLRYFFQYRDEDTWESFQDFLQLSRLSSYLRVAAIKK